jgi:hypothetical protein
MSEEPERELEDMEERSERLEDDIDSAREDWERKKQDPGVPGAPPEDDEPSGSDGERQA